MPDVYLLAEGAEGDIPVPHLALTFVDSGLALDKADGEPVWDSLWSRLAALASLAALLLSAAHVLHF